MFGRLTALRGPGGIGSVTVTRAFREADHQQTKPVSAMQFLSICSSSESFFSPTHIGFSDRRSVICEMFDGEASSAPFRVAIFQTGSLEPTPA